MDNAANHRVESGTVPAAGENGLTRRVFLLMDFLYSDTLEVRKFAGLGRRRDACRGPTNSRLCGVADGGKLSLIGKSAAADFRSRRIETILIVSILAGFSCPPLPPIGTSRCSSVFSWQLPLPCPAFSPRRICGPAAGHRGRRQVENTAVKPGAVRDAGWVETA